MVWSFLEKYPILGGPRQVWSKSQYQTNTGMHVPLSIYHLIYIWICAKCADGFSVSFLGKANDDI
jgi:hypothetical protein